MAGSWATNETTGRTPCAGASNPARVSGLLVFGEQPVGMGAAGLVAGCMAWLMAGRGGLCERLSVIKTDR